jgi:hypothetical protein
VAAAAAQEEAGDDRAVAGRRWRRAHHQELIERQLAVVELAAGQGEMRFEIGGGQDFPRHDSLAHVRGVPFEDCDHGVAQAFAGFRGPATFQFVGGEAGEDGDDVVAGRGEAGIGDGGYADLQVWVRGELPVFDGVEGAFEVVDVAAADADRFVEPAVASLQLQRTREGQMDLRRAAPAAQPVEFFFALERQGSRCQELAQSALRNSSEASVSLE